VNISEEDSVDLWVNCLQAFLSAEIQNHQDKSSLSSEQFDIEFQVSLESAFLGLNRRQAGSFPPPSLSFGSSTKSRDESVILNGFQAIEHRWNSMHSDQHKPRMSNSIFLV
jgi:hypothetical protein